jgi:hypothetical protein
MGFAYGDQRSKPLGKIKDTHGVTWLASFSLHPLATGHSKKTYWTGSFRFFTCQLAAVVVAGEFCPAKRCLDHFLHRERQHVQLAFEVSLWLDV